MDVPTASRSSSLPTVLLLTLFVVGSLAPLDAGAQRGPQAWTAEDPELEWGPCPAFMPESCAIAVLQGTPDAPNADVFFRMAPNTTVPLHRHTSPERMVLVSGEMHVTYDGHDPVVLRPGTYAHGPAELPHDAYCADGAECVLFIAFEDPIDAMPAGQ
ncbi:MAG: cupin domain-containing protein [Salinivenus sp.]